ncbi:ribosome rescue protein RqcH [Candidatus Methanoprimaticola sp. MG2]|uniref:ribosome rescue protein RqcH n=1 Tax=Candidatus Methanoprimaticola sp. MG2 TaxID=3228838 RepID=UPI0039C70037
MKKEMSSFDVRSIVTELASLEGAHMDKIHHWGAGNVLFRLNVQGQGKTELLFEDRKWLYCPSKKPETPTMPTTFASYLRKYIDNARIGKVEQVGFDRIVTMELSKSDGDYLLIFEMFGGGNVLLVKDGMIQNCLVQKTLKDRKTRPGEPYVMPKSRFDPTRSTEADFLSSFRASDADAVRTLATSVNLGGQYSEEVCTRVGLEKSTPSKDVDDATVSRMYSAVEDIVGHVLQVPEPTAYLKDGKIEDFAPVMLQSRSYLESKHYNTMSALIEAYLEETGEALEEAYVDPAVERLEKRISKQEETLLDYKLQEEEYRRKAEALYADYQKAAGLIQVLDEQSRKITWEKLKEGASKIPYVESIDPAKTRVTAVMSGETVTLDWTKGVDANASDLYQKGKDIGEKAKRAEDALKQSRDELSKLQKGIDREKALAAERAAPTKQFWFERYKWFITTGGRLVMAGRDTHSNDNVVKKHLKDGDLYAHADVHGAPSVVIKDGAKASSEELRQACLFALAQSKAWIAVMSEGGAFWVFPDQVSKTPNPGEFVPRGAFIVRGKRNYEYHLPMELAIGEVYHEGSRKVMCGPVDCFGNCEKYIVIRPGKPKSGRRTNDIAKRFEVPEEEISRIVPPGDLEVVREVWPKPDTDEE